MSVGALIKVRVKLIVDMIDGQEISESGQIDDHLLHLMCRNYPDYPGYLRVPPRRKGKVCLVTICAVPGLNMHGFNEHLSE